MAQNKAYVLQNLWADDLSNYNPKEFFDKLFLLLKEKIAVREFSEDSSIIKGVTKDESYDKRIMDIIKQRNLSGDSAYFIALSAELRLPLINLTRIIFNRPSRRSRFVCTINIYNAAGIEILSDTVVNTGCIVKAIEGSKSDKKFYADYKYFAEDMQCHLDMVRQRLKAKPLLKLKKF